MNTKQYYYLSTIAAFGNLTHAAQALQVSPSALSKFLSECERTFGFDLFLRCGRRLYPTAVGRFVVECAQKILDEQNRMLLTMKEVSGGNQDRIRLATAPNRGAIIYSKIYNAFSRRYPGIALNLTELYATEQPGAIARGRIDLALGAGPISAETTDLPVAHEQLLISLPSSHPLARQSSIRLADLQNTPFVLQGRKHSIRILAEQLFQEAGFQPVVAFESDDVLLVDSMMHQSVGVGFVSKAHVFPCDELVYRPLDPPACQTLHLRYPLGHTLTEPERYLAGLLVAERLDDPRYQNANTPLVNDLLAEIHFPDQNADNHLTYFPAVGPLQRAQEVNLDSKVMEYLIAIVEEQSLSRAADRYLLAQSALSRHLHSMEKMVGIPLFNREHNRLRPTSAGTIFVNNARNILRFEHEMLSKIQAHQRGHGGRLYLYCDPLYTSVLHNRIVPAFRALHPDISLKIQEANQEQTLEALRNASADLGIFLSTASVFPLLHCDPLALTEMVYCFAPDHIPSNWNPGDLLPAPLESNPQILAQTGTTLRAEQDHLLATLFPSIPPIACEAQLPVLCRLANLGIADSLLPLHLMERSQYARCAALDPPQPLYLLLGHHVGRTFPSMVQELIQLIQNTFSDSAVIPFSSDGF